MTSWWLSIQKSGLVRELDRDILPRPVVTGEGAMVLNSKRAGSDKILEEILH